MKVLLLGINYDPELTGIGKYSGELAAWLAERGHAVKVVTAPPYYPEWRVHPGYSRVKWTTELLSGVKVTRCPLWVPRRPAGLSRLVHLFTFAISSAVPTLISVFWRPSVVIVIEPPFFCSPIALLTARLAGAKAWLHVQDYELDAAFDLGLLRGGLLRTSVLAVEKWLLRRFDRVSTISTKMVERAVAKGVSADRAVLFPNWVSIRSIRPQPQSTFRHKLGLPEDIAVALYSGNMGRKQGLDMLAEVAYKLRDRTDIRFVFCGDGAGKEDLVSRCEQLSNVHFLPLQPSELLGDLLALADIHLLPQRAGAADLVMPSKLTGMLASGRPVVATASSNTELAQVVGERAQCGLVVPPDDAEAFAKALVRLLTDAALRLQMGVNARRYAERELDQEAVLTRFERELAACDSQ